MWKHFKCFLRRWKYYIRIYCVKINNTPIIIILGSLIIRIRLLLLFFSKFYLSSKLFIWLKIIFFNNSFETVPFAGVDPNFNRIIYCSEVKTLCWTLRFWFMRSEGTVLYLYFFFSNCLEIIRISKFSFSKDILKIFYVFVSYILRTRNNE